MRLFIKEMSDNNSIYCPFIGVEWDGSIEGLREIIMQYAYKDKKLLPFIISVLKTKREIVFNKGVSHPEANPDDIFFLFDNKKLLSSGKTLVELWNNELAALEANNS